MVRVRFAPSPTGYLHIGSARTALFNWLYARHTGGEFLLRIEDTDKVRSKKEYLDEILDSIKWLGLYWDGDIYFQSVNFQRYRGAAESLLAEGKAYRKEGAVYLKMPSKSIKVQDILHGVIEFDTSLIKDQVLIKSDGTPTYNFACVLDDSTMGITHVIRGDDHISNTPKQIVIYEALGLQIPQFCHIPLILGVDRSRLSKRHCATSIMDYRKEGILPEGLLNYLILLGWSPGGDRELISLEETVKKFELKDVNKTASVFDINKLLWINGQYIKKMDVSRLSNMLEDIIREGGLIKGDFDKDWFKRIVRLYQTRIRTLSDFIELAGFFFKDEPEYDDGAVEKYFDKDTPELLQRVTERFSSLEVFDETSVEGCVRSLADELGIKAARIIHPIRVSVTGRGVGAGLFETISLLGKERTIKNLKTALKRFSHSTL